MDDEQQPEPRPLRPKPRYIARLGKQRDYVDFPGAAAPREPECIGDGWLTSKNQWVVQHYEDVKAARKLRPLLEAEDRIRDVERRAKQARRHDLHGETRLMRRMLDRARAGGRHTPVSLTERLERVEADLDGVAA